MYELRSLNVSGSYVKLLRVGQHKPSSNHRVLTLGPDTPRRPDMNDTPNSQFIVAFRRDQIFQSSGPGTYPQGSRKTPSRGDIHGCVLWIAKIHQRLTPPSTVQIVHYINSSPVFIQVGRNRSRRPALGGREKNSTRQLSRLCSILSVC